MLESNQALVSTRQALYLQAMSSNCQILFCLSLSPQHTYLCSIYTVLSIVSALQRLGYIGGCVQAVYQHYTISYEKLEHLWTLV